MKENSFITLPPEGAAEMGQRGRVVAVRVAGDVDRVAVQTGAHVAVAVHLEYGDGNCCDETRFEVESKCL